MFIRAPELFLLADCQTNPFVMDDFGRWRGKLRFYWKKTYMVLALGLRTLSQMPANPAANLSQSLSYDLPRSSGLSG
jgi:hypothetical protein